MVLFPMRPRFAPSFRRYRVLLLVCLLGMLPCESIAQPPGSGQTAVLDAALKKPTGKNGFEEFLRAFEFLSKKQQNIRLLADLDTPLPKIRALFQRSEMGRVRALLHLGLSKPILLPYIKPPSKLQELVLHGYAIDWAHISYVFQTMAYILQNEMRLALADRRNLDAVKSLGDVLAMAQSISTQQWGYSIAENVVLDTISPLEKEMPQFSARDCLELEKMLQSFVLRPPDLSTGVTMILQHTLPLMREIQNATQRDPNNIRVLIEPTDDTRKWERVSKETYDYLLRNPAQCKPLIDKAVLLVLGYFRKMQQVTHLPPWQRKIQPWKANTRESQIASMLITDRMTSFFLMANRYRARVLLVGIHVKLRRYQLEYGSFPESLSVLKLSPLYLNPDTGKPFPYAKKQNGYELGTIK